MGTNRLVGMVFLIIVLSAEHAPEPKKLNQSITVDTALEKN